MLKNCLNAQVREDPARDARSRHGRPEHAPPAYAARAPQDVDVERAPQELRPRNPRTERDSLAWAMPAGGPRLGDGTTRSRYR